MDKATEMVVGAFGGAVAAELLKPVIEEAKKILAFKVVSVELASTMERLVKIVEQIDSLEDVKELEDLRDTIDKAGVLVKKCSRVSSWNCFLKSYYFRKVEKINNKMLKFCQIDVPLILLLKQLQSDGKRVYRYLCSVPQLKVVPVGTDWPFTFREIKKKLLDGSVDTLLVSAPPGCGKTTLVTQLCHDEEIKEKFKHIFFNVVSSAPDFRVLVQNLLQHNGYPPYTFDNDSQAIVGLEKLMEKLRIDGRILLVLDDVWHGLESLLQKFPINIPDLKILVTSRFAYPSFRCTYPLKPLEGKDAEVLLRKWALGPDHATTSPEYEDLLQKILKRCNGYPLVIEVVGASLKGQPLSSWKGQVESWSRRETILDNPTVQQRLQPSFDALNSNLKYQFMDLGSFREDQKIRVSVIIDIWVELYGTGSSMYMKDLIDLASQNLLKLIPLGGNEPEDGFYNDFLVTQHDILRELSIHQSKSKEERNQKRLNLEIQADNYPPWYLNLTEPINARLLSISTDDLFSSKWVGMETMECPDVEALVLNLSSSNYELPKCIATMKKLKVVVIINHGPKPAKLTNLECLKSLPNLKRIRVEKVSITLVEILQLQLQTLKKLSLVMCSFGKVSHDTKAITDVSKALPSLHDIDIDYCYDLVELPNWVSEIFSLKTLSITNCNKLTKLPEAVGKLSVLEVLRLTSCIDLSELPETTERLSNLQFLDISDCLGMEKLPLEIGNLHRLTKISMRKCWKCELPDSVTKLENLVVKCDEETASPWKRLKPKMINLEVHEEEIEHNLNMFKMF